MSDVVDYLQSKGVRVKSAGANNIHISCPFCREDPAKRGRLYISLISEPPALFMCHLCGKKGALNALRKAYGDPPLQLEEKEEKQLRTQQVLQSAAAYYHDALGENLEAFRYWREERGLDIDTIQKFMLGFGADGLGVHLRSKGFTDADILTTGLINSEGKEFLSGTVTIPYLQAGNVVMLRGRSIRAASSKYLTPPGNKVRLFNTDVVFSKETEIVITEGEIDCMALDARGIPAIGMPGANTWQDGWNSYLDGVRRVYLIAEDAVGAAAMQKVADKIGPRARIVHMPAPEDGEKKNDPAEWIIKKGHSVEEFATLLRSARGGLLLSVHDAFAEWDTSWSTPGLRFGIESIDRHIEQGVIPGQLIIPLAKSGAGKSITLLNMFHRMSMANNNPLILFVSLEQTRAEWFERARRISRFYDPLSLDERVLDFYERRLYLVDKNRLSEEQMLAVIEEFVEEVGRKPDILAVDYLGYWARAYKGEAYERTSAAVMFLKELAKDQRIVIISPHQVNRVVRTGEEIELDNAKDAGAVGDTADYAIAIWSADNRKGIVQHEKTGVVTMKMVKSRGGGTGVEWSMQFAPMSLAMIPMTDPLATKAAHEMEWVHLDPSWEYAIYRHATGDGRLQIPESDFAEWRSTLR